MEFTSTKDKWHLAQSVSADGIICDYYKDENIPKSSLEVDSVLIPWDEFLFEDATSHQIVWEYRNTTWVATSICDFIWSRFWCKPFWHPMFVKLSKIKYNWFVSAPTISQVRKVVKRLISNSKPMGKISYSKLEIFQTMYKSSLLADQKYMPYRNDLKLVLDAMVENKELALTPTNEYSAGPNLQPCYEEHYQSLRNKIWIVLWTVFSWAVGAGVWPFLVNLFGSVFKK